MDQSLAYFNIKFGELSPNNDKNLPWNWPTPSDVLKNMHCPFRSRMTEWESDPKFYSIFIDLSQIHEVDLVDGFDSWVQARYWVGEFGYVVRWCWDQQRLIWHFSVWQLRDNW